MALQLAHTFDASLLPKQISIPVPKASEGFSYFSETEKNILRALKGANIAEYALFNDLDNFHLHLKTNYHKALFLYKYEGDRDEEYEFTLNTSSPQITLRNLNKFISELTHGDSPYVQTDEETGIITVTCPNRYSYLYVISELTARKSATQTPSQKYSAAKRT